MLLDAYARRHEGQKIYLRQAAAQRWVGWRESVVNGGCRQEMEGMDGQLRAVSTSQPILECVIRIRGMMVADDGEKIKNRN